MSLLSLAGMAIAGGISSMLNNKAEVQQQEASNLLEGQNRYLDNMFNTQYYQNYMDRADVQAALSNLKKMQEKQMTQAQNTAVVMGSTPEALVANQQAQAELMGQTIANIAGQGSIMKDNLMRDYMNNKMILGDKRYNLYQNSANMFNNQSNMGMNSFYSGLNSLMAPKPPERITD